MCDDDGQGSALAGSRYASLRRGDPPFSAHPLTRGKLAIVNRTGQQLAAVAAAGGAALTYPLLSVASADGWVAGIPVLYVYLFTVWAVLIGAMALIVERRR